MRSSRNKKIRNLKKSLRRRPLFCYYDSLPLRKERFADPRLRQPAFIVGSERSGTTILGDLLKFHKNIHCTSERDPVFSYNYTVSLQVARMQHDRSATAEKLRRLYIQNWLPLVPDCESWRCKCQKDYFSEDAQRPHCCWRGKDVKVFIDKSQHVILFPELIQDAFPQGRFIWIYRDPRAVVASMMSHYGVRRSIDFGRKVLVPGNLPNPWAGVRNEEEALEWFDLPFAGKCAKRWASWCEAGYSLQKERPDYVYKIKYEEMIRAPQKVFKGLLEFLDLPECAELEAALQQLYGTSLETWRERMSAEEADVVLRHAGRVMDLLGYEH